MLLVKEDAHARALDAGLAEARVAHVHVEPAVALVHEERVAEDVVPVHRALVGVGVHPGQHGQHRIAPELAVHAQRGAAREAAREQVVVRQAVGVRAARLDDGRQADERRERDGQRARRARLAPAARASPAVTARVEPDEAEAAETATYGIAGMKCFTPPKIGVAGQRDHAQRAEDLHGEERARRAVDVDARAQPVGARGGRVPRAEISGSASGPDGLAAAAPQRARRRPRARARASSRAR